MPSCTGCAEASAGEQRAGACFESHPLRAAAVHFRAARLNGGNVGLAPRKSDQAARWVQGLLPALPWAAAAIGCWPLLSGGFPKGHDWLLELVRVAEYQAALAAGQLPPFWAENLYGGYGSPVFLFYAPLFSAGSSLLGWLLGSPLRGALWCTVLVSFLAVPAMRAMLKSALVVSRGSSAPPGPEGETLAAAARVGVSVYVLNPYLLGDKLLRNASAEFAALCLMPLLLYGVLIASRRPRAGFGWISGGLAIVILTHNLSALVASALAVGVAAVCYLRERSPYTLWVPAGGLALGLGGALFLWFPAFSLTDLIRTEELLRGRFDFHNQFPSFSVVFGYSRFYATGALTPLILAAGLAVAAGDRWIPYGKVGQGRPVLVAALIAAAALLFLLAPLSTAIWEAVPLMPLFQFPWRMLGPLALLCALVSACVFARLLAGQGARRRMIAELGIWGLCVSNAVPALSAYTPLPPATVARLPVILAPASIRRGRQSVSVLDEYLPRAANRKTWRRGRPAQGPLVQVQGEARIEVIEEGGTRIILDADATGEALVRVARWAFPGWTYEIDGIPAELSENEAGSLDLPVPPGRHRLALRLRPPWQRRVGLALSCAALVLWLVLLIRWPWRRRATSDTL